MFSVSDINTINALLSPIVEEYRALRNEIASLNKQQYNMAFLFSLASIGAASSAYLVSNPVLLCLSQLLLIGHAVICIEFESRIYALR